MKRFSINTLKKAFKTFKKNAGFTLIEIMIVVAIIGLLSAIAGPALFNQLNKARATAAAAQIESFNTVLLTFALSNGSFPSESEGLQALVAGGFMRSIPKDPWGNDYVYRFPGTDGRAYDIISYGRDGKEGGTGLDADIIGGE